MTIKTKVIFVTKFQTVNLKIQSNLYPMKPLLMNRNNKILMYKNLTIQLEILLKKDQNKLNM